MRLSENMEDTLDDVESLKACVSDLISLLALPAIWSGGEPSQIVSALLDVLLGMLHLDFAAVLWNEPEGDAPSTMIRVAESKNPFLSSENLSRELEPWMLAHPHVSSEVINSFGGIDFSLAPIRIGLKQGLGVMIAGSRRKGFPNSTEKLLLRVAVNQAAVGLQDAWLLQQQKEIARRLDRTIAQTQAQLSRAAQVATAAQLSASIAHEINQPLSAIVNNSNAALHWLAADPPNIGKVREIMETIVRDGKGAAEVVQRVRALFKGTVPQRTSFSLNELIHQTLGLLQFEVNTNEVTVETELQPDLPLVAADRVQLQQVILNLFINAIEATDSIGDRAKCIRIQSRLRQSSVLVQIQDNGIGIEDEEKVFETFFTTKRNGMGLGLSISRSMVESNEGQLWVESTVGAGTSFFFTIPVDSSFAQ